MTRKYLAAIDQGTTSTRCMVFDRSSVVSSAQLEHRQITSRSGWVEHDPVEIWVNTQTVVREAMSRAGINGKDLAGVGITNQRETTLVWDRRTGKPCGNAIVWQDTRTQPVCDELAARGGVDRFRASTGLPIATYFSASKLRWMLDHVPGLAEAAMHGQAMFGTIDSWLIYKLTGQAQHVTDVSNASRTMLMNLQTLDWDESIIAALDVPRSMLPKICPSSSSSDFGRTTAAGCFGAEVPITGVLGDQQAALFGQACFLPGESKVTYGTGCFILLNTGLQPMPSKHGLLTTVGYQLAGERTVYALEGSIAVAGSLVQWLRDQLGLIGSSREASELAASVPDNGGVFIVPAFSGLFAPHWRADARGTICGLTHFSSRAHLARAALESTAFQVRDVIDAMRRDSGVTLRELRVDGGMTASDVLMQFQSDILDVPIVRPKISQTTALGAAYAAGLAVGFWNTREELRSNWVEDARWTPALDAVRRAALLSAWDRALQRSLNWV